MISHIFAGANDFEGQLVFYASVLETLGWSLKFVEADRPWAGFRPPGAERPLFLLGRPDDGASASAGNGQMVALLAASRGLVDQAYQAGLAAGGTCDGPPGLRPHYHPNYYGAYLRDLEGAKICICCHDPA